MLPYVRGITFSCKVIDLGTPLEVVLSHPNPKLLAQTASSVVSTPVEESAKGRRKRLPPGLVG